MSFYKNQLKKLFSHTEIVTMTIIFISREHDSDEPLILSSD